MIDLQMLGESRLRTKLYALGKRRTKYTIHTWICWALYLGTFIGLLKLPNNPGAWGIVAGTVITHVLATWKRDKLTDQISEIYDLLDLFTSYDEVFAEKQRIIEENREP